MALRKQGLSHQAIAERVGVGHSTVQSWIAAGTFPERKRREQASQLDPYLSFIRERWAQGSHNMARIHRDLITQGYKGSYESVRHLIISLRQGDRHAPVHSILDQDLDYVLLHSMIALKSAL